MASLLWKVTERVHFTVFGARLSDLTRMDSEWLSHYGRGQK